MPGKGMTEIHVEDMGHAPGLWVSFKIQILYSKCSQDQSEQLDANNSTKGKCIPGMDEISQG